MYRSLAVILGAIIILLAAATAAAAQGRGFRGGAVGHGGAGFRGATSVAPPAIGIFRSTTPAPFRGSAPFAVAPFRGGPGGFARHARPIIVPPVYGYYSGYYSPFYSPYIWPSPIYDPAAAAFSAYSAQAYSEPVYASTVQAPQASQGEVDLAYQVGRLSAEIEQLRQQQQQPQAQAPAQLTATPTVLVFRDGHRMEIQNYAIVGQSLWVLDERAADKIPLSDLDLEATQRENRSRGVRFAVPGR